MHKSKNQGLTIVELLITTVLIGILSSISLPSYFRQLQKTKQGEAANILTFLSTSVMGYVDEFGTTPETWEELSEISTVMTPSGPVTNSSGKLTCGITIQSGDYTIHRTNGDPNFIKCSPITSDTFIFEAVPTSQNQGAAAFNVISCVDSKLGVSDLKLGSKDASGAVDKNNLISICQ
jgi:type IV pilus assembly protein PilA